MLAWEWFARSERETANEWSEHWNGTHFKSLMTKIGYIKRQFVCTKSSCRFMYTEMTNASSLNSFLPFLSFCRFTSSLKSSAWLFVFWVFRLLISVAYQSATDADKVRNKRHRHTHTHTEIPNSHSQAHSKTETKLIITLMHTSTRIFPYEYVDLNDCCIDP